MTRADPPTDPADLPPTGAAARIDRRVAEYSDRAAAGEAPSREEFLDRVPDADRGTLDRCLQMIDAGLAELPEAGVPLGPGVEIGGFRIVEPLGRGGMAVVFRAEQAGLARRVALKVLRPGLAVDRRQVDRFRREARAVARLSHPNVVHVFAVGEEKGHPFLAMEEVAGPSLADVLRRLPRGRRTAADLAAAADAPSLARPGDTFETAVARILGEVLEGVSAAHEVGVVHRDLKPSNILIHPDGRAVVADFGLARSEGDVTVTRTDAVLGTPDYMSPEQVRLTDVRIDERTDVYSLGVTLYEALGGRRPFAGDTAMQVFDRIREGRPAPLRSLAPDVGADAEAVVARAIARSPDDRYPTARAMADDLARLADGRTTDARLARGGPTRRFARAAAVVLSGRRFEFRSRAAPLGLPLVHVRTGDRSGPWAKGWLAIGTKAVGLLAIGPIAVGGVALGALGVGALALGLGVAAGGLALSGGVAVGGAAAAGAAVGGVALGGLAVGGVAVGGTAIGPAGISPVRRDEAAVSFLREHAPFVLDGLAEISRRAGPSPSSVSVPSKEDPMLKEATLALSALAVPADGDPPPGGLGGVERTLGNGVRAAVVELPSAPSQAFFTILPLGLLADAPGEAQFAHLLEHMMIRSTDPDALEVDGLRLNGETNGRFLRLESIGPPDRWRTALDRHAGWLSARDVDPEVLAREKVRIAGEEEQTARNGYTGKWALAAWNQVVRHGLPHAAVHGDVADATVEAVRRRLAAAVPIGDAVRVVAVGPASAEEVLAALEETIGAIEPRDPAPAAAANPGDAVEHEATWDLDAFHHAEWYPLPDASAGDRLAAAVLARVLTIRLASAPDVRVRGLSVIASDELATPEGRALQIG
ncbi:MAG: protein kinase, partial [Planctomycetota bacterium JB042]